MGFQLGLNEEWGSSVESFFLFFFTGESGKKNPRLFGPGGVIRRGVFRRSPRIAHEKK
jgi:hypothetical protein